MVLKSPLQTGSSTGGGTSADTANVMDYGARGDGTTNDTVAIQAAFDSGKKHIIFPWTENGYRINTGILVENDGDFIIEGVDGYQPALKSFSTGSDHLLTLYNGSGFQVKNLRLTMEDSTGTGNCITLNDVDYVVFEDVTVDYGRAHNVVAFGGSTYHYYERCHFNNSANDAFRVDGCSRFYFSECEANNNGNFGIYCLSAASEIVVDRSLGHDNDLEFFICNWDSTKIAVTDCVAYNNGDNGISLGGFDLKAIGNRCYSNQNNGIAIYGRRFVCVGNQCYNNNQAASTFSGIVISPAWGGIGSFGTVSGNTCIDTQAVPTQAFGIELHNSQYTAWSSSTLILAAYPYRVNAGNLYRASAITVDTVCGTNAPVHTSGTVSDGVIAWTYLDASTTSFNAGYVAYGANTCFGNVTAQHKDTSGSSTIAETKLGWLGIGKTPDVMFDVYRNTSGTNTQMSIEQAGSGDCNMRWLLTGQFAAIMGLDNSDSDKLKCSSADNGFASGVSWEMFTDGRFRIVGGEMRRTVAQPAGGTLTTSDSGNTFTNEGASARTDFTLPTAVAELEYSFFVQDSDGIRVIAGSGDTIRVAGSVSAAAGRIDNATIGSSITIRAINATEWVAMATVGTWTPT